jgi:GntR family transcriptional regulator, arabinose operon transcriptional repressor
MSNVKLKNLIIDYIKKYRSMKKFRLPSERVLASELGYSRATIGKVLGILEGEGLIIRKKGSGTYISETEKNKGLTIALVMRKAYHSAVPHFKYIVDNVSRCAEKQGIYIQIYDRLIDMFNENDSDNQLIRAIETKAIDGVLFVSRMPISIISNISSRIPVSAINNIFGDGSELPCVSCNYFYAGFIGAKYLLDKGHRNIVYLNTDATHIESYFELSGIKAAYQNINVPFEKCEVLNTGKDMIYFKQRVIKKFTDSQHTACFVRAEDNARPLISILKELRLKVPQDVSLITVGDYIKNNHHALGLTVIDNHLDRMATLGVDNLLNIINGTPPKKGITLLEPNIIERNSVIDITRIKNNFTGTSINHFKRGDESALETFHL